MTVTGLLDDAECRLAGGEDELVASLAAVLRPAADEVAGFREVARIATELDDHHATMMSSVVHSRRSRACRSHPRLRHAASREGIRARPHDRAGSGEPATAPASREAPPRISRHVQRRACRLAIACRA